ncbi:MAG: OmpA family protein [Polyangiales bacterium]
MQRTSFALSLGLACASLSACSIVTVKQDPFPAMKIQADRPEAPPPRVILTPSHIQITEKIQFAFDSAEILPVSHGLLNEVAGLLKANPQIEELSVEGHTDKRGAAAYNKKLSQSRAESVRDYLVSQGVERARLVATGYGFERPLSDGEEEADHELNRRVEFNILKQGMKKTLVQEN